MYIDSSYYSNRDFAYDSNLKGTISLSPQPNTKVAVGTDTVVPHIRIKLSQAMADSIVAQGLLVLNSNALWVSYFKGLFIQASPVNYRGAISYFDFFHSAMKLYFHDTSMVSKVYDFSLQGARVNRFSHTYGATPVQMQLTDPLNGDSVNYLLSMCGIKTNISFPYLKHFSDSGSILINKAELKITATAASAPYNLPLKLLLITKNSSGVSVFPIDYYESTNNFGGTLNTTTNEYTFNLARQLQGYLDGTVPNTDFELIISGSGVEATRAIIKSGSNQNNKIKLSLSYTKLY